MVHICYRVVYMLTIVGLAWKAFNVEVFKAQLLFLSILPSIKYWRIVFHKLLLTDAAPNQPLTAMLTLFMS